MLEIKKYLDDLETRMDERVEEEILLQWRDFCNSDKRDRLFYPQRPKNPPKIKWPDYRINAALKDSRVMMIRELAAVSLLLESGSGSIPGIRANYGCTILPSLFGVKIFYMDDVHNTLPANYPLGGGTPGIKKVIQQGIPGLRCGQGAQVLDTTAMYVEYLADYPKLSKYLHIYPPDLQSPIDNCETLWGSEFFLALYDCPNVVKDFLSLLTDTYSLFMRKWFEVAQYDCKAKLNCGWGWMQKGNIRLSEDSAVNLSPRDYEEFVLPYDGRLIGEFGGTIHYCGNGGHFLDLLLSIDGLSGYHMGQPELNDPAKIAQYTLRHKKKIMKLRDAFARELCSDYPELVPFINCF